MRIFRPTLTFFQSFLHKYENKSRQMPRFLILLLCSIQCCFSQTDKIVSGNVVSDELLLKGVDVINDRSRLSETTNGLGHFSIMAQVGDTLIFHSVNFTAKKICIKEADFADANFRVFLYKKIEELDEVVISNTFQPVLISNYIVDKTQFGDGIPMLKNPHIYTAKIADGPDLVKIVGLVATIFKKPKEPAAAAKPTISFKQFVNANYDREYLKKTFDLKEDEVSLFLEFCEADAEANSVKESEDPMALLELLIRKDEEFRGLGKD